MRRPARPGEWYGYTERYDYLQMTEFLNVTFDLTQAAEARGWEPYTSSRTSMTFVNGGNFSYAPVTHESGARRLGEVGQQGGLELQGDAMICSCTSMPRRGSGTAA